jgi:hypothetical protein
MTKEDFFEKHGFFKMREATQINGIAYNDEALHLAVGGRIREQEITEILISNDGRGSLDFYHRASVWSGDQLISEHPVHNLECVFYA